MEKQEVALHVIERMVSRNAIYGFGDFAGVLALRWNLDGKGRDEKGPQISKDMPKNKKKNK